MVELCGSGLYWINGKETPKLVLNFSSPLQAKILHRTDIVDLLGSSSQSVL